MILSRLPLLFALLLPFCVMAEETRDCREQEFKDQSGSCFPCRQCDAGQELSKECGFGFGEDARCVPCKGSRFKEERSLQKCKPCMDCSLLNRYLKSNCSSTRNALCGDCLPGFYRKTKLSGFQDMECIPCGDPPPPYEPHCMGRVKLVPLPSAVDGPRDVALAAVICSALASVLLALCILCVIYCKRQLLESKPELSCLDRRLMERPHPPCCHCIHQPAHTNMHGEQHTFHNTLITLLNSGGQLLNKSEHVQCPIELISSVCCDETWSQSGGHQNQPIHTHCAANDGLECHEILTYSNEEDEKDEGETQAPHTTEETLETDD
ncbi:hypothetical protein DNTS_027349 [Danionella cerebrum]|uniref:TNFR-Cys domain-containing protein n=1 Tax=Danionella cerebrum TaxID=2873325 RepID=A0A553MXV9_9TELE|nr:hypothetical protein DNTS_027349 [Danionella translucida]